MSSEILGVSCGVSVPAVKSEALSTANLQG